MHRPSREKSSIACVWRSAGHFLRSGFGEGIAELRRFLAILAGMQPSFSATQTVWRSAQSRANSSPPKFPANREKYREFTISCSSKMHLSFSKLHILLDKWAHSAQIETGMYQGINRTVSENLFLHHGFIAERTWLDADFAETQTADAAPPNSAGCSYTSARTLR